MITLNFYEDIIKIRSQPNYNSLLNSIQTAYSVSDQEINELILTYEDVKCTPIRLTAKTFKAFQTHQKTFSSEESITIFISVTEKSTLFNQSKADELKDKEKKMKEKGLVISRILEETRMKRIMKKEEDQRMMMMIDNIVCEKLINTKRSIIQETINDANNIISSVMVSDTSSLQLLKNERSICNCEHKGIVCDGCGESQIRGMRYKCTICTNFNYCYKCEEEKGDIHKHPFFKIRYPIIN